MLILWRKNLLQRFMLFLTIFHKLIFFTNIFGRFDPKDPNIEPETFQLWMKRLNTLSQPHQTAILTAIKWRYLTQGTVITNSQKSVSGSLTKRSSISRPYSRETKQLHIKNLKPFILMMYACFLYLFTKALCYKLGIDLFASNINRKCRFYVTFKSDVNRNSQYWLVDAFPSVSIISRSVSKIKQGTTDCSTILADSSVPCYTRNLQVCRLML